VLSSGPRLRYRYPVMLPRAMVVTDFAHTGRAHDHGAEGDHSGSEATPDVVPVAEPGLTSRLWAAPRNLRALKRARGAEQGAGCRRGGSPHVARRANDDRTGANDDRSAEHPELA